MAFAVDETAGSREEAKRDRGVRRWVSPPPAWRICPRQDGLSPPVNRPAGRRDDTSLNYSSMERTVLCRYILDGKRSRTMLRQNSIPGACGGRAAMRLTLRATR